jgi:cell division protein FtsB
MTLTAFIISVLWILTLILVFSLFLQVIELKAGQKSLDQQISDLRKQVHKNQHNIENIQKSDYIQNLNQQASVSKHLIKG